MCMPNTVCLNDNFCSIFVSTKHILTLYWLDKCLFTSQLFFWCNLFIFYSVFRNSLYICANIT